MDNYYEFVKKGMFEHATHKEAVSNWVLGLAGEAGEVRTVLTGNSEDLISELGDYWWYLHALYASLYPNSIIFDKHMVIGGYVEWRSMIIHTLQMCEQIKKALFHPEKSDAIYLKKCFDSLSIFFRNHIEQNGIALSTVEEYNVTKLTKRYPEVYK